MVSLKGERTGMINELSEGLTDLRGAGLLGA